MPHPLELEARKRMYDIVCRYPGIHLRELQRKTGMATGTLDYHLHFLHKHGLLRVEREGRYTRYYNSLEAFGDEEKRILSVLRQESLRHIVLAILNRPGVSATGISEATGLQPSNLSGHLKTLEEKNVIFYKKHGRFRHYQLRDSATVIKCLMAHKKSFLDTLVDSFIDTWAGDQKI